MSSPNSEELQEQKANQISSAWYEKKNLKDPINNKFYVDYMLK